MNILYIILLLFIGTVMMLLNIALFSKKEYNIERKIIIEAPIQKVFDYIRLIKNWDNFNKWAMADPDCKKEYKGTDGTVGFIYTWNGNKKAGEGENEILEIINVEKIKTEIRFVNLFKMIGHSYMTTDRISNEQTKVTMRNTSSIQYPLNILIQKVEKGFPKDMDISLSTLKNILEK